LLKSISLGYCASARQGRRNKNLKIALLKLQDIESYFSANIQLKIKKGKRGLALLVLF